jgi:hypothetical protein
MLVFDVLERRRKGFWDADRHGTGPDWTVLSRTCEVAGGSALTREITSFRRIGRLYRRTREVHRVALFEAAAVRSLLDRHGFRARVVRGYGTLRFRRGHVGFIAWKR